MTGFSSLGCLKTSIQIESLSFCKSFEFSLPSLHVGRFSPCFSDRCGRLSVSISLARPAVAGGSQILPLVYRAAVAEAFRFVVGHVAPAVAGGFQDRVGLSIPPLRVAPDS